MKYNGLTSDEVKELMKQGKTNYVKRQSNQTYLSIFVKNIHDVHPLTNKLNYLPYELNYKIINLIEGGE